MVPLNPGRRTILKLMGLGLPAAALGAIVPTTLTNWQAARKQNFLESADLSAFSRHLGERFSVQVGAFDTVAFELREVTDLGLPSAGLPIKDRFSIIFRGPAHLPLEQGTYRFEHAKMEAFPLFIVPIHSHSDDRHYQAIFNHV